MIIDNLDVRRTVFRPSKANPPLVVDPDRMLASSILGQRLQTIARRNSQIVELLGGFKGFKLPASHRKYLNRKALRTKPIKNRLSDFVLEASDHDPPSEEVMVSLYDTIVNG